MHKNINKIINTVLIGSIVGTNIHVFAVDNIERPSSKYEILNKSLSNAALTIEDENLESKGPFVIDNSISLGIIPDSAVDLSLADEYVKALVKKYIKADGTLMLSDLVKIVRFDNTYMEYDENLKSLKTNYEWLKFLPNLQYIALDVSESVTSGLDVTALISLKNVESLELRGSSEDTKSQLTNITQLYSLQSQLTKLSLRNIKSLESVDVSKINGLKELSLEGVQFVDENQVFATFPKSTTLKTLIFENFENENYVPYFINLEELYVYNLKKNIDLNSLKNLNALYISGNFGNNGDIAFDVNNIKSLTNLKTLSLNPYDNGKISNQSSLESLTNLEFLYLSDIGTSIDSVNFNKLAALKVLSLDGSNISSLKNITNLTSLLSLNIIDTKITSLSEITDAKFKSSLESLSFGSKNIANPDLSILSTIPNLSEIELYGMTIKNVDNLFSLKKIDKIILERIYGVEEINITNTTAKSVLIYNNSYNYGRGFIEKINIKEDNKTITRFEVSGNTLIDTSFVSKLKSVKELNLNDNQITDISSIISMYAQLEDGGLDLNNNFIPKEQMEKVKSKFWREGAYSSYKIVSKVDEDDDLTINEQKPGDLIEFIGLKEVLEDDDYSISAKNYNYRFDVILDDPKMGYIDSNFKLIPTKKGQIPLTIKLYGDKTDSNSFKMTFNSVISEDKGSVKVMFIDADTKEEIIKPVYHTGLNVGDVAITAENIDGYKLVGESSVNVTIDKDNLDKTVTFEYKKEVKQTGTVTINFIDDKTGAKIKDSIVVKDITVSTFTYNAEKIDGYNIVGDSSKTVNITSDNLNHTLEFRYAKIENGTGENSEKGTITIKYIDKDTVSEIAKSETLTNLELKTHTIEAKSIPGYKLVGESKVNVELTKENKNKEITFAYTKDKTSTENDYDVIASKTDIENAISKKTGLDLISDKTTLSVSYEDLSKIKSELSELSLTVLDTPDDKSDVESIVKNMGIGYVDCFGVLSNVKDLSSPITAKITREYAGSIKNETLYLYRVNKNAKSVDLSYVGTASYKSGELSFNIQSNQLDGSTLIVAEKKYGSSNNNTSGNQNTSDKTENTDKDTDKDTNKDKETIPDTSGISLVVKVTSLFGIIGSIFLIKKKKK